VDRRPYAGTISFSFMQQPKLDFSLSLVSAVDLAQVITHSTGDQYRHWGMGIVIGYANGRDRWK
jgi:hypothetical protein